MIEDSFNFLWSYKLLLSRIDAKDMRNRFQSSLSVTNIFYSPISKFTLDNNMPYLIYLPILDGDNLIQSIWIAVQLYHKQKFLMLSLNINGLTSTENGIKFKCDKGWTSIWNEHWESKFHIAYSNIKIVGIEIYGYKR